MVFIYVESGFSSTFLTVRKKIFLVIVALGMLIGDLDLMFEAIFILDEAIQICLPGTDKLQNEDLVKVIYISKISKSIEIVMTTIK